MLMVSEADGGRLEMLLGSKGRTALGLAAEPAQAVVEITRKLHVPAGDTRCSIGSQRCCKLASFALEITGCGCHC